MSGRTYGLFQKALPGVGAGVGDGHEGAHCVVGVLGEGDGRNVFAVPDAVVEGGGEAVDFGRGEELALVVPEAHRYRGGRVGVGKEAAGKGGPDR